MRANILGVVPQPERGGNLKLHNYDLPDEMVRGPRSPAYSKFVSKWFYDTAAITDGDLDLTFLKDLTPEELTLARGLIRRNLKLRYTHIIRGVSALRDVEAAPILRAMYDVESDPSRRLTLAGALWKLGKDPIFLDCLNEAKATAGYSEVHMAMWIDDYRSVKYLIDVLAPRDRDIWFWRLMKYLYWQLPRLFGRFYNPHSHAHFGEFVALHILNELELGRVDRKEWRPPSYFRKRRDDPAFRKMMTAAVHKWNSDRKNLGW